MYEIRLEDGTNIYYQGDADYAAYDIECVTQKGDAGYLQFTLPKTNPMWKKLVTRQSVVEFILDGESLGFFEVREKDHDYQFAERIYAVGELAWLYDSIQPQAEFRNVTPRSFLTQLITQHNKQCPEHTFRVGTVNVVDNNESLYRFTNRETTLDDIRDKLVDRLGGQIKLRRYNGVRYIDYLTDETFGSEATQRIYFGENLLDYSDTLTVDGICSEVIPLGATLENDAGDNSTIGNLENRLTVESVNDGKDYVSNSALVARFGHVRCVKKWDDVTIASNLLTKARKWLTDTQFEQMHLSVKAIDLSLTSTQFGKLRMGDSVRVVAEPYGLDKSFPITKRTYHPDSPDSDVIELSDDVSMSYIATQAKESREAAAATTALEYNQTQWIVDAIDNVNAMLSGSRGGYRRTTYDKNGKWQADYYLDSSVTENAKKVRRVNNQGDAYSTNGINGTYTPTKTMEFIQSEMEFEALSSGGTQYGVKLTPLTRTAGYINGALVKDVISRGNAQTIPLKSYVDGKFPSDAKSDYYTIREAAVSVVSSGSELVGLKVTPYTTTMTYTNGFLTARTQQSGSAETVALKSYVDSLMRKMPTFSLSGTTLTIKA